MSIVFTEDRGSVRHVILNRPEKRNAMNQELLLELGATLREAAAAEDVHCVVLRGEGPVFSAGVDLGELAQSASRTGMLRPFRQVFLDCANLCEEMAKPVVCQIRRACLGGALEVALGCDLRVADSESQLGLPEVKFGIIPDVGGSTPAAGRGRTRPRQGDDHDRQRRSAPRRRSTSASSTAWSPPAELDAGHRRPRRGAARQLPRRGRPRQAGDGRLRPPALSHDAGDGDRHPGVLRGSRRGRPRSGLAPTRARARRVADGAGRRGRRALGAGLRSRGG